PASAPEIMTEIMDAHSGHLDTCACPFRWSCALVQLLLALLGFQTTIAGLPATEPSLRADIFNEHPIWQIAMELGQENIERLRSQPRGYVRANVRVMGEFFRDVGVHLKGSTGSFRGI